MITVKIVTRRSPDFTLTRTIRIPNRQITGDKRKTWHDIIDEAYAKISPFEDLCSIAIVGRKI